MYLLSLCFIIFVQSISANNEQNCPYGTLTNGVIAWGINMYGSPIPGASGIVYTGPNSILLFNKLWYKQSSFIICMQPLPNDKLVFANDNNVNDCDYGMLNNGVAVWGMNNDNKRITTTIIVKNGTASIDAFTNLIDSNHNIHHLCFQPLPSKTNEQKCLYGTLSHGIAAWGLDIDGNPIAGSLTVVNDGPDSIEAMNNLWYNLSSYVICLSPLFRNGKIIIDNDNCDYGLLNNGVTTWGANSKGKWITPKITTLNGADSINAFTNLINKNCNVTRIWFHPSLPSMTP